MGLNEQMARDCCVRGQRCVEALRDDKRAGVAHGFHQQGIARRLAELRRSGMVEADEERAGFMRTGQQSCEDGSIPWPSAEFFVADGVPCDNEKGWADWDGSSISLPEIVDGPIQRSERGWGCGPQAERKHRCEQPHRTGLEPGGTEKLSPQMRRIEHDDDLPTHHNLIQDRFRVLLGQPLQHGLGFLYVRRDTETFSIDAR